MQFFWFIKKRWDFYFHWTHHFAYYNIINWLKIVVLETFRFDNPASYSESPTKQLTYSYLIAFNSWLLLFPCDLSCDWTHASIRLVSNLNDPRIWMTGAFFVTLIYLVYYALIKSKDEKLVLVRDFIFDKIKREEQKRMIESFWK